MKELTLIEGVTTFRKVKRGLMIVSLVSFSLDDAMVRLIVPKVGFIKETTIGKNTIVRLGSAVKLTMPNSMWVQNQRDIIAAAMGEDAV